VVSLDAVFGYQSRLLGQSSWAGSESIRQSCSSADSWCRAGAHAEGNPRSGYELLSRDRREGILWRATELSEVSGGKHQLKNLTVTPPTVFPRTVKRAASGPAGLRAPALVTE
jgi:hypothetical protein